MLVAHVAGVPVEEMLPTLASASTGLLMVGAGLRLRVRRRLRRREEPGA
jgi:hypothetical protein